MRTLRPALAALCLILSATAAATPVSAPPRPLTDPRSIVSPAMAQTAPAPVAALFSVPESWDAAATPDGRGLVYASDVTGRLNLWYVDTAGGSPRRLTTSDERHWGIAVSPDSRTVVYTEDLGGAEMFDLHAVPVAGGPSRNLTRTPEASETGAVFSRDARQLAFARRPQSAPSADIVVMDVASGVEKTLTAEKLPDRQWSAVAFSADGRAVYARRADIGGAVEDTLFRITIADGRAEPVIREPASPINPVSDISPDERWLALSSYTADGRKQAALFDIRTQTLRLLAPGPWEQRTLRFSPDGRTLLFLDNIDGRSVVKRHDIASARTETLSLPSGVNADYFGKLPVETTDGHILFPHQSGTEPLAYWSHDRKSGRNTAILRMAESEVAKLPPTQVVTYPAKDGTLISAILWTPTNARRDGGAAAVVIAHGGPTGQTEDRYDATAVALAARGYFVIAPNPRGSTGYGRDFMRANLRDLGGGDLDDYVAGVKFLVDTGYVDAKRVGITGVSYGGYMTMIALGRAPEVFAAGVQICGITNWTSMHERGSPALRAYQEGLIGHPVRDREVYERVSPLTYLDRYEAPLLVLQGDNDIRVPKFEAEQVVATLRRLGKTVDARYYPDEGHGLFRRENKIDGAERTIDWFDRHLRAGVLVQQARVVDGTGAAAFVADVRIRGDRIVEVAPQLAPLSGETQRDARGLVLSPGFIDVHSHAARGLLEDPDAATQTRQGITTMLVGQDGESAYPLRDGLARLEATPRAVNVASLVGHATVRAQVMGRGLFRAARPEEVAQMRRIVADELAAGAFGLSTGLEYEQAHFSTTEEVIELAKVASAAGGVYISHVRDEGLRVFEAFDEVLRIGREAKLPVQITHIKLGAPDTWHLAAARMPGYFERAAREGIELRADVYPYTYWHSTIRVLVTDRDFFNREKVVAGLANNGGAANIRLARYTPDPRLAGKTIPEIAAFWGVDDVDAYMRLVRETMGELVAGGEMESIIGTSMSEEDVRWFVAHPRIAFSSDGELHGAHPRGAGTFPRVLGRYVREQGALTLEAAVHKMTGLAAGYLGLTDRGRIAPGFVADLVLLDPATVIDNATVESPEAPPTGIVAVMNSGVWVVDAGLPTGNRPGKVLRHAARAQP